MRTVLAQYSIEKDMALIESHIRKSAEWAIKQGVKKSRLRTAVLRAWPGTDSKSAGFQSERQEALAFARRVIK